MSEPFLSEIKIVSFNFAPKGWALCNGQLLPINQNQALFSLLGTTYGGDGRVNFALPNLQGRVGVHVGGSLTLGQLVGEQAHTLTVDELPVHLHTVNANSDPANTDSPAGAFPASTAAAGQNNYSNAANTTMNAATVGPTGGSQAHNN